KERNEWLSDYFGVPYILLGDADDSGDVDILDATYVNRAVLMISGAVINEAASDVDADGEVTVIDATFIQRYEAKFAVPHKIGEKIRIK
ncbi:MAG: dockerin type I repeat-containing protein, partial [Ruminococcus sp.]|nr:dockerin type I repeat-containing protein [Ruminococcus sp.]